MQNIQRKDRLSIYSQDILHRNHRKHLASTMNASPNLKIHPRDKSHLLLQKCTRDNKECFPKPKDPPKRQITPSSPKMQRDKSRANSSRERRNHDE